jgi:Bacterial PH domain
LSSVPADVQKILGPNEQVKLYIPQKIYHPKISIDSVVITNERVILRHPHAMGLKKDYTDYNYNDISNAILDKGMMRSTIRLTLRFGGEPLVLGDLPNDDAQAAYGLIRENLMRYQNPMVPSGMATSQQQTPPPATEVVEREVVKVRCRYCGTLNDESSKVCSSCGATL